MYFDLLFLFSSSVEMSHALVAFTEEDNEPISIVPVKRFRDCDTKDLKEGLMCRVMWSDKQDYPVRIIAVGEYLPMHLCVYCVLVCVCIYMCHGWHHFMQVPMLR